ncbi:MAG: H-type lectin domain-containing protein [Candidatus Marinimicrobia bacterium]|nr:H-type lectin domain-containing protein [FCB group bacterium]MBL7121742.1 H-type lectin domain-containing protein [Candidatus Neomarinimicrobiota bacterium]
MNDKSPSVLDVVARLENLEQKISKIEEKGLVLVETGMYTFEQDPQIATGKGDRETPHKIVFGKPLISPPEVVAYITAIESEQKWNTRIGLRVKDITASGATIVVNSWSGSKLYRARINWIVLARISDL